MPLRPQSPRSDANTPKTAPPDHAQKNPQLRLIEPDPNNTSQEIPAISSGTASDISLSLTAPPQSIEPSPTPAAISEVRLRKDHRSPENAEVLQRRRVITIGDLEANADGLKQILHKTGIVHSLKPQNGQNRFGITKLGMQTTIIQTGDIFDRGENLLPTLKYIQALRKNGVDFKTAAGNHDLMALYAFSCPSVYSENPCFYALINEIIEKIDPISDISLKKKVDKIIYKHANLFIQKGNQSLLTDILAFCNWYYEGGKETLYELRKKYCKNQSPANLREPLETGYGLFFNNGPYSSFIEGLSALEHHDDTLHLHGNLDLKWAKTLKNLGAERLNQGFRESVKGRNFLHLAHGNDKELFWRRGAAIDPEIALILKEMGIKVIIRGHDPQDDNKQHISDYFGIKVINNDVGNGENSLGAVLIEPSGQITGFNHSDFSGGRELYRLPPLRAIGSKKSPQQTSALG